MNNLREKVQKAWDAIPKARKAEREWNEIENVIADLLTSLPAEPFAVVPESKYRDLTLAELFAYCEHQFHPPKPRRRYVYEETGEVRPPKRHEWYWNQGEAYRAGGEHDESFPIITLHTEVYRNGEWVREG